MGLIRHIVLRIRIKDLCVTINIYRYRKETGLQCLRDRQYSIIEAIKKK